MTTRPATRAHFNNGETMHDTDWNTYVRNQKLYSGERIDGTNADKSPLSALSGVTGFYWNYLVNAGLETWPKGPGAFTVSGTMISPGWVLGIGGTSPVGSAQRVAALESGHYAAQVTLSSGTGAYLQLVQTLENSYQYAGKTLSVSARVQGNVVNCCYGQLGAWTGAPGSGTFSGVNTARNGVAGVPTTLSASVTIPYSTNVQQVYFALTLDAFSTVILENVMLTVSAAPVAYLPLPAEIERQRNLRRMQDRRATIRFPATAALQTRDLTFTYPTEMAATPTASVTAGVRSNLFTTPTITTVTPRSFRYEITSNAAGDTYAVIENVHLEATP